MYPVFLQDLESAAAAKVEGRRVRFGVEPRWCAPGESRLGYPGILRLMECVRELHWRLDVIPRCPEMDTITKTLEAEFLQPVEAGSEVTGEYALTEVRGRSYVLEIVLRDSVTAEPLARGRMVSVFYDEGRRQAVEPPTALVAALRASA
ncbi:MAG: acyl-CoA thioesterase [Solirubrobacterales bacterium]